MRCASRNTLSRKKGTSEKLECYGIDDFSVVGGVYRPNYFYPCRGVVVGCDELLHDFEGFDTIDYVFGDGVWLVVVIGDVLNIEG